MDRLPKIVFLLLLFIQTGCSSIFSPDKAISDALQAYLPVSGEPDTNGPFTARVDSTTDNRKSVEIRVASQGNAQLGHRKEAAENPPNGRVDLSSWQKIEKELSRPPGPPGQYRPPRENSNSTQAHRRSISDPNPQAHQQDLPNDLIRIYGKRNRSQETSHPIKSFPLIQRPAIYDHSVVGSALEPVDPAEPDFEKRSDISWKDSLEATIDHLHEELKSLQGGSKESEKLRKCLNILKSVESDSSFVHLVDKLELLNNSLPPHQFEALKKVIEQTDEDKFNLISQLRDAVQKVSQSANLKINNADFCTEVKGFGKFKKFDSQRFQAGDEVLLYCELENFSEEVSSGLDNQTVRTSRFDAQIEFINHGDETNYVKSFANITDQCQTNRKDYYLFFRFQIPNLDPGTHRLQVRLNDKIGRKNATLAEPIQFEVVR